LTAAAPLIGVADAPVPEGGQAEWFEGRDGRRLRAALFPVAGPPRGSVVVSGGRTEAIEKYFEVVDELRARGFCVLVHDWRGQGLSDRLLADRMKGHGERAQDFLADYDALLEAFAPWLPKPWIALGHSMGGCFNLLSLARGERRLAGAAFTAPMLGVLTGVAPTSLARGLARLAVRLGGGAGALPGIGFDPMAVPFEGNILTHDARRYARNQSQLAACPDLMLGVPTWGWLNVAFEAMDELASGAGASRIGIPVCIVAAGDDRLVDVAAERLMAGRIPGARLVEVKEALHEIMQETDDVRAVFWRAFDELARGVAPTSPPA
jgi:lysophospholipase